MSVRAAALVAGLAAAAWVASRDHASISLPALYRGYAPADSFAAQLIEPVLHAPWVGAVSWPFAGLLALCLASEAWLLSILYGAARPAAAAAVIATIASVPLTASARHGGSLALALAFSWLAWLFLGRLSAPSGREGGPSRRQDLILRSVGILSWIVAIAASWLAVVSVPMVLASLTIGEHRKRVRAGFVVVGVVAGIAGLALYSIRVASLTTSLTANGTPTVSFVDVLLVLLDPTPRPQTHSDADLGLPSLVAIALAALGAAGATTRRRWRAGVVLSAACGAIIAAGWPLWRVAVCQLVVWLATPFVAVGLTMMARALAPRRRQAVATVAAGVVLCVVALGDRFTFHAARETVQREPLAPLLGSLAVDAALFVVEDLDVDAAIVAAQGAGRDGWRVVQHPAYVGELIEAGRTVVAGPVARRHLELAGIRFQRLTGNDGDRSFVLSRATGRLHCTVVRTDRWSLLPGLEYTGRLGVEIPGGPGGTVTFVIGDDERPAPVVTSARGDVQRVAIEPLLTPPAVEAPPPDYWFDGGDPAQAPSHVLRMRLPAHPTAPTLFDLALGRRAPRVLARLTGFDAAARGSVCAAPLAAPELWADGNAPREAVVPLDSMTMLTAGWYGVEGAASGERYRWTDGVAVALIPSGRRVPVRVLLEAEPAVQGDELPTLGLRVNGVEQPTNAMRGGLGRYEWEIPARIWLAGTNELVFRVSRVLRPIDVGGQDARVLGMRVTRLALERGGE